MFTFYISGCVFNAKCCFQSQNLKSLFWAHKSVHAHSCQHWLNDHVVTCGSSTYWLTFTDKLLKSLLGTSVGNQHIWRFVLSCLVSGIQSFTGRYFHSWHYRNAEDLQGKRVVVIGMGNSGGDLAVDVSRVAEKVYNPFLNFCMFFFIIIFLRTVLLHVAFNCSSVK